jgi:hypothetical protein
MIVASPERLSGLEQVQSRIRPLGHGLILTHGLLVVLRLSDPIIPYGDGSVFARIPGNKLPGYDHLVPPGQSPTTPFGTTQPSRFIVSRSRW